MRGPHMKIRLTRDDGHELDVDMTRKQVARYEGLGYVVKKLCEYCDKPTDHPMRFQNKVACYDCFVTKNGRKR